MNEDKFRIVLKVCDEMLCYLSALSSDPSCQLDVFGHDGDSLGVDGAQVSVLEQAD